MRPADPSKSRIVLVGTASYDDPQLLDVPQITNNLNDLASVLTDPYFGVLSADQCVVAPPKAGAAQIGRILKRAADEAEDLLMFYFAGHGLLSRPRRDLYLALSETDRDTPTFSAVAFDAVRDACRDSHAANRVIILDCCFSGRAIEPTLSGMEEVILGQIEVSGTYTLTSAPANGPALVLPGEKHTAFTGRMIEMLRSGSIHDGPYLTPRAIYMHLTSRMRAEGLPLPQQCGTETAEMIGLVRNRAIATVGPNLTYPAWKEPIEARDAALKPMGTAGVSNPDELVHPHRHPGRPTHELRTDYASEQRISPEWSTTDSGDIPSSRARPAVMARRTIYGDPGTRRPSIEERLAGALGSSALRQPAAGVAGSPTAISSRREPVASSWPTTSERSGNHAASPTPSADTTTAGEPTVDGKRLWLLGLIGFAEIILALMRYPTVYGWATGWNRSYIGYLVEASFGAGAAIAAFLMSLRIPTAKVRRTVLLGGGSAVLIGLMIRSGRLPVTTSDWLSVPALVGAGLAGAFLAYKTTYRDSAPAVRAGIAGFQGWFLFDWIFSRYQPMHFAPETSSASDSAVINGLVFGASAGLIAGCYLLARNLEWTPLTAIGAGAVTGTFLIGANVLTLVTGQLRPAGYGFTYSISALVSGTGVGLIGGLVFYGGLLVAAACLALVHAVRRRSGRAARRR